MKKETKKEWFLDRYCKQQFAALIEEGKLVEFSCENEPRTACVGNVYKGKVTNVLSGMNAAFINCGLAKNCYLSMEETYTDCSKYDGTMDELNQKSLDLKVGDEIIVQVTKPPRGNKGAKVTTHLSFVGKNIIYLPNTAFLGISRRIVDETQRANVLATAEKMREHENEGFIVRTSAPLSTQKQLKAEVQYLKKLYLEMTDFAKTSPIGTLLYEDDDLPARVIRDCVGDEISTIHVGDEALYHRLSHLAKMRKDFPARKLKLHGGERSLFQEYGISPLITQSLLPKVPLDNGAYLVIDHTEAMTVVDVNTGSYVGETSLEETVFSVNLAAAKEIARQVRLRNVGGIVVVDFIDMLNEEHKTAVTEELRACLALDKAKCNVLPMSELCLTQFTRKRVGQETSSYYEKVCPHCEGSGYVPQDIMTIKNLRESILDCFADGYTAAIIDLNEGVMQKILNEGLFSIEAKNRWKEKRIYFIPHKTYAPASFTVRGDNTNVLTLPAKAQILY